MSAVQVMNFQNPHLFWIFEQNKTAKRVELEEQLEKDLTVPKRTKNPVVRQLVVVRHKTWKRAVITEVVEGGGVRCWLVDYGVFRNCKTVYELPPQFMVEPPLVKQAMLNNVVNLKQFLHLDMTSVETIQFCAGTTKRAKDHILAASSIDFHCILERGYIHVGELIITVPEGPYDLAMALIKEKNLAFNHELFQTALERIRSDDNVPYMSCSSTCKVVPNSKLVTDLQEFGNSPGVGRGNTRNSGIFEKKNVSPTINKDPIDNKEFMEKWLAESKNTVSAIELEFESDEEPIELPSSPLPPEVARAMRILEKSKKSPASQPKESEPSKSDIKEKPLEPDDSMAKKPATIANDETPPKSNSQPALHQQPLGWDAETTGKFLNITPSGSSLQFHPSSTVKKSKDGSCVKSKASGMRNPSKKSARTALEESATSSSETGTNSMEHQLGNYKRHNKMGSRFGKSDSRSEISSGSSSAALGVGSIISSGKRASSSVKDVADGQSGSKHDMACTDFISKLCVQRQGCNCSECKGLITEETLLSNKDFTDSKQPKQRPHGEVTSLFKDDATERAIEIQSHNLSVASHTDRGAAPKLLVHGFSIPSAATSVASVAFHLDIHRSLRTLDQPYTIQSFSWPCLMRNMNVCMVNTPKSGKTLGYLPAICTYLLERKERYEGLPHNTMSPIVIILCPGAQVAEGVFNTMTRFVEKSKNSPNIVMTIPPVDRSCLDQFKKKVDALITTPKVLIMLLRGKLINIKCLCHLVLESGDQILEKFPKQMESFFNLVQNMLEHRRYNLCIQMIVCAENWTIPLENLMKRLYVVPAICICSHLESALYGRADIQMKFLKSNAKMHSLAELLKDEVGLYKTIVICNNDEEIMETKEYLTGAGVEALLVYDTMESSEINDLETKWRHTDTNKHLVLLCTDQVFSDTLNITNAHRLVHYSLPKTWTQFANRFSCLIDNYASPLATKIPANWENCKIKIFVDEGCTLQFPKLVQFLRRFGTKLPSQFLNYYLKTIRLREAEKLASKKALCTNLKLFGKCIKDNSQLCETSEIDSALTSSTLNCKKRHVLSAELDYSSDLPKSGIIKFKIVHIRNVTLFTVHLLEHIDSEGKTLKLDTHETLHDDLQAAINKQKISAFNVNVGNWYVLCTSDNTYQRCVVEKIVEIQKITKIPSIVYVRLLENGIIQKVSTSLIYELPKSFHSIRPLGVDVYLANMVPPDSDTDWSSTSKSKTVHTLEQADYKNENVFVFGQILLQLGNIYWLKNLYVRETLPMLKTTVSKLNMRKSLHDQNLINSCEDQLRGLYDLCKRSNIELPDYDKIPVIPKELQVRATPQWAFFDSDDCNVIYIASFVSPSMFFVRLKKFYDLFRDLQIEMQEAIMNPLYPTDLEIEIGKYCLAKDYDGEEYCRAKILEVNDNLVKCCYVDFGDVATIDVSDLKYLSDDFIVKLPFQAIECRLYGVKPIFDDWSVSALDMFSDYIFEPDTDYYRTLYTTSSKQEPATMSGGEKSAVLLLDNFDKNKVVVINQILIDCGQGEHIENEDINAEFFVGNINDDDDADADVSSIEGLEDKELTIEDINRLSSKYNAEKNNNEKERTAAVDLNSGTEENVGESEESKEHTWDIVVNHPDNFMKLLIGLQPDKPPLPSKESKEPELQPIRAVPPGKYSTPFVFWHQTDSLIKINIMLSNVVEPDIQLLRQRVFIFKGVHDGKQYNLKIQLYDQVQKTHEQSIFGQDIKIILTKSKPGEWPRLTFTTLRTPHIKYDISKFDIPEEKRKRFLQLDAGDDELINDGFLYEFGSDEDYNQSDADSCNFSD